MDSSSLPSGTLAFLLTDIEGSTRLWVRNESQMMRAVLRHNQILNAAISAHRGHHFKTVGDAFQAVFVDPVDAVAAAVTAQRGLLAEEWPETGPLRVRMGIHIGEAAPTNRDYLAPCLNLLSRVLSSGSGGQVLLTDAVSRVLVGRVPDGVSLKPLGRHRFRDIPEAEAVTQLVADGLLDEFTPLKSLERNPTNLPHQRHRLIGREHDLTALCDLLKRSATRLVTLTGAGGAGKTRLALHVATDLLPGFDDGVFVANLQTIHDPDLVIAAIAQAIGVHDSGGRTLAESLAAYLADRDTLLVLDNLEQVIAGAPAIGGLLDACGTLKILATSREPLRLQGEHEYAVTPLPLPDRARQLPVADLQHVPSVALFVERASAIDSRFALTPAIADTVAQICARLDGLPLAIELAAAPIKMMPVEKILQMLSRPFKLLTRGSRDAEPRQSTLWNTIAWSYDLLSPSEQAFFRRLAVCAGGCSIELAEAITMAAEPLDLDAFTGISALIDKSLLRFDGNAHPTAEGSTVRYGMLQMLREFGLERMEEAGELESIRLAHLHWFDDLVNAAARNLVGEGQEGSLHQLDDEYENLRAALQSGLLVDAERGGQLAGALTRYWNLRGQLTEGRFWSDAYLKAPIEPVGQPRLSLLVGAAGIAVAQGDYDRSTEWAETGLQIAREANDLAAQANLLNILGHVTFDRGQLDRAEECFAQSLELARTDGGRAATARALSNLGAVAQYRNEDGSASMRYEESLAIWRELGDRAGISDTLFNLLTVIFADPDRNQRSNEIGEEALLLAQSIGDKDGTAHALLGLGIAAMVAGQFQRAEDLHRQSLDLFREIGNQNGIGRQFGNLGQVALESGDIEKAVELSHSSLDQFRSIGDPDGMAFALDTLASTRVERGDYVRAAELFGAADGLRESMESTPSSEVRCRRDLDLRRTMSELGESTFNAATIQGRQRSVAETIKQFMTD